MKVRFSGMDSESGEQFVSNLVIETDQLSELAAQQVIAAFNAEIEDQTGEKSNYVLKNFAVAGRMMQVTMVEQVTLANGHSYEVFVTGIVYTIFI